MLTQTTKPSYVRKYCKTTRKIGESTEKKKVGRYKQAYIKMFEFTVVRKIQIKAIMGSVNLSQNGKLSKLDNASWWWEE